MAASLPCACSPNAAHTGARSLRAASARRSPGRTARLACAAPGRCPLTARAMTAATMSTSSHRNRPGARRTRAPACSASRLPGHGRQAAPAPAVPNGGAAAIGRGDGRPSAISRACPVPGDPAVRPSPRCPGAGRRRLVRLAGLPVSDCWRGCSWDGPVGWSVRRRESAPQRGGRAARGRVAKSAAHWVVSSRGWPALRVVCRSGRGGPVVRAAAAAVGPAWCPSGPRARRRWPGQAPCPPLN